MTPKGNTSLSAIKKSGVYWQLKQQSRKSEKSLGKDDPTSAPEPWIVDSPDDIRCFIEEIDDRYPQAPPSSPYKSDFVNPCQIKRPEGPLLVRAGIDSRLAATPRSAVKRLKNKSSLLASVARANVSNGLRERCCKNERSFRNKSEKITFQEIFGLKPSPSQVIDFTWFYADSFGSTPVSLRFVSFNHPCRASGSLQYFWKLTGSWRHPPKIF